MKVNGIIYLIRNLINNKLYVGQTKFSIDTRWKQHCRKAKRKPTTHFEHAINKYGEGNFSRIQIDCSDSLKELDNKEIHWINFYKTSDSSIGYNTLVGGSMRFEYLTKERQKESVEKLCLSNGKGWFDVYDYRNSNFVGTWCNTHEASRVLNVAQQNISHCLSNRIGSIGHYIFVLKNDINYTKIKENKIDKAKENNYNPVLCFNLIGEKIGRYKTCGEACRILNVDSAAVSKVISGEYTQHNNYLFIKETEYSDDLLKNKLIEANQIGRYDWFIGLDLTTGERIGRWSSGKHACKELNIAPAMLQKHLYPSKGQKVTKRIKNYIFIFEKEDFQSVKKKKIKDIIECESTRNKGFVKKNPIILDLVK